MIRPARSFDTNRIVELLVELHASSKYAGATVIDEPRARKMIAHCIHRHGHSHEGGAFVMVAIHDQKIEGFMVGILSPVYQVCDLLAAEDVFLYCSKKAHPSAAIQLFGAYVAWATNNPKVHEIKASWTDAVKGAEKIETLYEHKGFRKCGGIYEKVMDRTSIEKAAA